MSDGIRLWDANGALMMDENTISIRVVLSTLVSISTASQTYQTFSVPGVTAANSIAVVVPTGSYDTTNTASYETEVINDAVRVYNYIRGFAGTQKSSAITMRLIVMRFA